MKQISMRLIGDIGGTHARFALAGGDQPGYFREQTLACADFDGVEQAIHHYLGQVSTGLPGAICLAIAGPIADQQVQMTNHHWLISARQLSSTFGSCPVRLINDFEAVALSIPSLPPDQLLDIGPALPDRRDTPNMSIAVLGPGTGLGVSNLRHHNQVMLPLASEAGHVGFAPETRLQERILSALRKRWPHVSIERLLSGPGIENIYWALNRLEKSKAPDLNAAEIFCRTIGQQDQTSATTVKLFFEILGQVAGDLALAYGAQQGVYIAGGIVKRYPKLLTTSGFRASFENKGRHRNLLERIPTRLIVHPQPGLLGATCSSVE